MHNLQHAHHLLRPAAIEIVDVEDHPVHRPRHVRGRDAGLRCGRGAFGLVVQDAAERLQVGARDGDGGEFLRIRGVVHARRRQCQHLGRQRRGRHRGLRDLQCTFGRSQRGRCLGGILRGDLERGSCVLDAVVVLKSFLVLAHDLADGLFHLCGGRGRRAQPQSDGRERGGGRRERLRDAFEAGEALYEPRDNRWQA